MKFASLLPTLLLFTISCLLTTSVSAQYKMLKPTDYEISKAPHWAQLMYQEDPNVFEVEAAYRAYFQEQAFVKTYHTQYYKRWRRGAERYIQTDGRIAYPNNKNELAQRKSFEANRPDSFRDGGDWSLLGPITVFDTEGVPTAVQSNVYSFDQSASDNNVLFCGTETGLVFRSNDEGESWINMSLNDPLDGGVLSTEIHPNDPDVVFIGSGSHIFRTIDGGITWESVLYEAGLAAVEILAHPDNESIMAATDRGFFRSTDGGDTWDELFPQRCHDIKLNAGDNNIIYLLKNNPAEKMCEFWMSTDGGETFEIQTEGWYESDDPDRQDGGARLAVSADNPDRVYAYLIGEAKAGDTGFIGVYRSDDGGVSWTLPNGPAGGPYDETHQNLAIGNPDWQYHQGYYNCALMANPENADQLLLGGLNLYQSDDGGETFTPIVGYNGGIYNMHVDMQDFRAFDGVAWITTDGGIYRSEDFFQSDAFATKMSGIHASDYWGFGSGWNEDVLIGGCYHNGNISFYEPYGYGNYLQLGGGEPASGYVNQGENRRVYSSDINGRIMPMAIGDPVESVGFGIDPNESYWEVESTELEFAPNCYSIAYTGLNNQLWKTTDKGSSFYPIHTFAGGENDNITYIEPSWSNSEVIYVCQQLPPNQGKLWRTDDSGENWEEIDLPSVGNTRRMLIQVDPLNEDKLWLAFTNGGNDQKIYYSDNGGDDWENLSTVTLDGHNIRSIVHIGQTDGDIYLATYESVFYRNNTMDDWEEIANGLPIVAKSNIMRPFYRDEKLRLATYGSGIWETPLINSQAKPIAQIMVDQLEVTTHCEQDVFHFVDHSMLAHEDATWEWTFEGGTPSTADTWEAEVTFDSAGDHLVTLIVTDRNGQQDTDTQMINVKAFEPLSIVEEGFEEGFLPAGFELINEDNDLTWELNTSFGAYGESDQCIQVAGFDYWPGGAEDDLIVSIDTENLAEASISFDVSYVKYAPNYSDSLEVLVRTSCEGTYESVFFKGGDDLATGPDFTDAPFTPTAEQWRNEVIDLTDYLGHEDVSIAFRFHSGWGQHIYLDNINLSSEEIVEPPISIEEEEEAILQFYPNLISKGQSVYCYSNSNDRVEVELFNAKGKSVYRGQFTGRENINLGDLSDGIYMLVMRSKNKITKGKLIVN